MVKSFPKLISHDYNISISIQYVDEHACLPFCSIIQMNEKKCYVFSMVKTYSRENRMPTPTHHEEVFSQ